MPRQLLCEGLQDSFVPEVICVTQGDKALFLRGSKDICESVNDFELVESIDVFETEDAIVEGKTVKVIKNGQWLVEGPFQRSDTKNKNKRTYPRRIWERIVAKSDSPTMVNLNAGGMLGHMEHPADGRTDGKEGAIITRGLELREDGVVWGKAEILNTPNGLILQEYTKKGVRWGVSSRGNGSVDTNGVVTEDYALDTFDAVMRPSTDGAYPTLPKKGKTESEEVQISEDDINAILESADSVQALKVDEATIESFVEHFEKALEALNTVSSVVRTSGGDTLADAYESILTATKKLTSKLAEFGMTSDDLISEAMKDLSTTPLIDALTESEYDEAMSELRQQLEELKELCAEAGAERDKAQATLIENAGKLHSVETELNALTDANEKLSKQVEAATDTIESLSQANLIDGIQEAVESAVNENDQLRPFMDLLERERTPEEVFELAKRLTAGLISESTTKPDSVLESVVQSGADFSSDFTPKDTDRIKTDADPETEKEMTVLAEAIEKLNQ